MSWLPRDKYLWDFWFARTESELHAFYLQASHLACGYDPNRRHDQASIGHAVLTAGGWKEISVEQPVFACAEADNVWDNLSIWTGSIIQHPDTRHYYFFYTSRQKEAPPQWTPHERQRPQNIGLAVSTDLNQWTRFQTPPLIPNPGWEKGFDGVAWRDPYLVHQNNRFYAFICARRGDAALDAIGAGGVIAYVTSPDLEHWDSTPQILVESTEFYQMEVPQVFWRQIGDRKRLYLLFCAAAGDCSRDRFEAMPAAQCQTGTYYMVSDAVPLDTEEFPPLQTPAKLLSAGLYAGKLIDPETAERPLFYSFPWVNASGHFEGGLTDPCWAVFKPDGAIELSPEI